MLLPTIPLENVWDELPNTKNFVKDLLIFLEGWDVTPMDRAFKYIEFINGLNNIPVRVAIVCPLDHKDKIQKGLLSYAFDGFDGDNWCDKINIFLLKITNAKIQDFEQQGFTICHELAHLFIAYEVRQKIFLEKGVTSKLTWSANAFENTEMICDYIAYVLMLKIPFPF